MQSLSFITIYGYHILLILGEDADTIGGVKSIVLKQSGFYEDQQPKRSYIDRPLPISRPSTTTDNSELDSPSMYL